MRISNSGFMDNVKRNLTSQAERIGQLYGQVSSGKRLQQLADDPSAAVRALRAHASLNELEARQTVAQQAQQLIGATDAALSEVSRTLSQAKDLCLQANTPTVGPAERAALAAQIRALRSSLIVAGNAETQGHYIFSGSLTTTPALKEAETTDRTVTYCGNTQQLSYQVGPDEKIAVGFTGAKVFNYPDGTGERSVEGVDTDVFSLLSNLADVVETGDSPRLEEYGAALDELHAHAVKLRGEGGVLAQRWKQVQDKAASTGLLLNQVLADEESVDITAAIVDLSNLETAYRASLSLTSRLLELPSLFDLP